jgi:hypothetical protein
MVFLGDFQPTDKNKDEYVSKRWEMPTGLPLNEAFSGGTECQRRYSEGLRMKQGTAGNCHFTAALASVLWARRAPKVCRSSVRLYDADLKAVDVPVSFYLRSGPASLLPFDAMGRKTRKYHLICNAYLNIGPESQAGGRNFNRLDQPPDGTDLNACLQGLRTLIGAQCEVFKPSVVELDPSAVELKSWLESRRSSKKFVPTLLWSSGGEVPHAFSVFAIVNQNIVVRDAKGSASETPWQTLPQGATKVGYGNGSWPTNPLPPENSFGLFTLTVTQLSSMLLHGAEGKSWHLGGVSLPSAATYLSRIRKGLGIVARALSIRRRGCWN